MCALILLILFSPFAQAKVYLLGEPIQRTVELPKSVVALTVTADLAWTSASTAVYFGVTAEPFSTAVFFSVEALSGIPGVNAEIQALNHGLAQWRNRAQLKSIAKIDGARELRMLNTGYAEQTGIYSSRLHASSFIFLDMEEGKTPAPLNGKEWIPLDALDETKIRFLLKLPGGIEHPRVLELKLKDVFTGAQSDQEVLAEWRRSVQEWEKSLGWIDRHLKHKGTNELKVLSSLLIGDSALPLGEYSQGKGVHKILGLTRWQKLKAWVLRQQSKGREVWQTSNAAVIHEGGCATWYSRILGRRILVP